MTRIVTIIFHGSSYICVWLCLVSIWHNCKNTAFVVFMQTSLCYSCTSWQSSTTVGILSRQSSYVCTCVSKYYMSSTMPCTTWNRPNLSLFYLKWHPKETLINLWNCEFMLELLGWFCPWQHPCNLSRNIYQADAVYFVKRIVFFSSVRLDINNRLTGNDI